MFNAKETAVFYRQLSVLLGSGMPPVESLNQLSLHMGGRLRSVASVIGSRVASGGSFADALAEFPSLFAQWQIGTVRAAEKGGNLSPSLSMIADQLEKDYADLLRLMTGLAYPAFMLGVALLALPLAIRFGGCGLSSLVRGPAIIAAVLGASAACLYFLSLSSPGLALARQQLVLALPVAGGLIRQMAVTRFMRALQSLVMSGVPLLTAWRLAADASGNMAVKQRLVAGLAQIERGGRISDAFSLAGVFPPYMVGMISSGERSGSIGQMLGSAAGYCEKENEAAIAFLLRLVPAAVYAAVALFIGIMAVSFYAGYFNQFSAVLK